MNVALSFSSQRNGFSSSGLLIHISFYSFSFAKYFQDNKVVNFEVLEVCKGRDGSLELGSACMIFLSNRGSHSIEQKML